MINDLARSSVSGEGEAVTSDYLSGGSDAVWSQDLEVNEDPFESQLEETDLIYSDADPETSYASDRPEDLVYATTGQESTEAVDSLLSDREDWWK